MTYTLGGTTLPNVQSEIVSKKALIMVLPFPTKDANETEIFDYGGVTAEIIVDGTVNDSTTFATFRTNFLGDADLDGGKISGAQTGHTYNSDTFGAGGINTSVTITNITTTYNAGIPDRLDYSISMSVGVNRT
jgi:hypothetical protein